MYIFSLRHYFYHEGHQPNRVGVLFFSHFRCFHKNVTQRLFYPSNSFVYHKKLVILWHDQTMSI